MSLLPKLGLQLKIPFLKKKPKLNNQQDETENRVKDQENRGIEDTNVVLDRRIIELLRFLNIASNQQEAIRVIKQWENTPNLDFIDFLNANTGVSYTKIAQTLANIYKKKFVPSVDEEIISIERDKFLLIGKSGKVYSFISSKADVIIPKPEYERLLKRLAERKYGTETKKFFYELVEGIVKHGKVSDIKISPEVKLYNVYAIFVGEKKQRIVRVLSKEEGEKLINFLLVSSGADPTEKRKPQSAKMRLEELGYEMRLEFIPSEMKGMACVIRLFSLQGYFDKTLKDLNLEPGEIYILRKHAHSRKGLVFLNGETSSGKSTTIRAMINEANPETTNVWAVEQPVEIVMRGVNHIQVREGIISFSDAIKSFMRVNPRIIFVGEVRDSDTAKAVLDAVSTGHMVFTTLHTKDNASAILRFVSLLQDDFGNNMDFVYSLIADSLALSVNQRLVTTVDGKIKPILNIFEPKLEDRKLLAENRIVELRQKFFLKGDLIARKVYNFVKKGIIHPAQYIEVLSIEERNDFVEWLQEVIKGNIPYNGSKPSPKVIDKLKRSVEEVMRWEEEYFKKAANG